MVSPTDPLNCIKFPLEEEGGVTDISIRNITRLVHIHGPVKALLHNTYCEELDQCTDIFFEDGFEFRATGFSSGYFGEGPRGLSDTILNHLDRRDITLDQISGWEPFKMYFISKGQGNGKPFIIFPGVMDGEYDVEIW